jgi:hypothetical protein
MKGIFGKIWGFFDGWKTAVAYVAAHLFGDYPLVLAAFQSLIANPKDMEAVVNFIVQLALAVGVADRVRKNLRGAK